MYVKIEKDFSTNFLLIEAKEVDMRSSSFMMKLSDYVSGLVIPLCEENWLSEKHNLSKEAREKLAGLFPSGFVWDNIIPVSEYCTCLDSNACECNCCIKGVVADGLGYITSGRIYILNDNGQTIQKI